MCQSQHISVTPQCQSHRLNVFRQCLSQCLNVFRQCLSDSMSLLSFRVYDLDPVCLVEPSELIRGNHGNSSQNNTVNGDSAGVLQAFAPYRFYPRPPPGPTLTHKLILFVCFVLIAIVVVVVVVLGGCWITHSTTPLQPAILGVAQRN